MIISSTYSGATSSAAKFGSAASAFFVSETTAMFIPCDELGASDNDMFGPFIICDKPKAAETSLGLMSVMCNESAPTGVDVFVIAISRVRPIVLAFGGSDFSGGATTLTPLEAKPLWP
ncbi:MAG: hypothetical protein C0483_17570 [Pirellula sp.]|nr:hypothetical protein [Pirellula sp.]